MIKGPASARSGSGCTLGALGLCFSAGAARSSAGAARRPRAGGEGRPAQCCAPAVASCPAGAALGLALRALTAATGLFYLPYNRAGGSSLVVPALRSEPLAHRTKLSRGPTTQSGVVLEPFDSFRTPLVAVCLGPPGGACSAVAASRPGLGPRNQVLAAVPTVDGGFLCVWGPAGAPASSTPTSATAPAFVRCRTFHIRLNISSQYFGRP